LALDSFWSARCGSLTTALRRQIKVSKHPGRSPVERCRSFRDIQDRDGAFHLLRRAPRLFPFIERIFLTADTRDARLAMTVWAHWCLELANRQAIGRCSI